MALVKSEDLFDLPELHGGASVRLFFVNILAVLSKEGEVIIILPIQIMMGNGYQASGRKVYIGFEL